MSVAKTMGVCPYCREPIQAEATKCKHCQSDLTSIKKPKRSYFARFNTFKYGFVVGVCFTVLLLILV
ncbi:MAG TPA: hypothetical protein VMS71_07295, partial [Candidatus Acidoferrum sp.]|nr:hypothetical protein [Candidatus Acidoferrum sp.]